MELRKNNRRIAVSEEERRRRVHELRSETGARLSTLSASALDGQAVRGHIENFIGTISVPVGLAGPLKIEFPSGEEVLRAPMATTEGALVSSVSRGALAFSLSGGVRPRVLKQRMIRAPQFEFESLDEAIAFMRWAPLQKPELAKRVGLRSTHARLEEVETYNFGRTVHVRLCFTTGNASGQNMTTFCASELCRWLIEKFEAETGSVCVDCMIEGNLSSDKKVSAMSASQGRGHSVIVEGTVSARVLKRILKISVDQIIDRFLRSKSARIYTGMPGFNINLANVVAGLFLATGQDMACVHESSVGELHMERKGEDLYVSLLMPALVVGTVGGGTALPSFRDSLEILGCHGDASADRLAMIVASFAIALEISTLTAIGTDDFVGAHERHSRKLMSSYLRPSDLNAEFFKKALADSEVLKIKRLDAENKEGHVAELAFQVSKKFSGMMAFEIEMRDGNHSSSFKKAFLKIKPKDREIVLGAGKVLMGLHPGLADLLVRNWACLPFKDCHLRELEVFDGGHPVFRELAPAHFGSFSDQEKESFILIQELLDGRDVISPIGRPDFWTPELLRACVDSISKLHNTFEGQKEDALAAVPTLLNAFGDVEAESGVQDLWDALGEMVHTRIAARHPRLAATLDDGLENFDGVIRQLASVPQTVIHYDFNPRNIAFRDGSQKPVIFDWEFTAWGPRQRDLFEFLVFASTAENLLASFEALTRIQDEREIYRAVLQEFAARRLPFYVVMAQIGAFAHLDSLLANLEVFSAWVGDV